MKHYVFFDDDYPENGGIGLEECGTKQEAKKFIEERLGREHDEPFEPNINNYTVIYGKKAVLETVTIATKVKIEV